MISRRQIISGSGGPIFAIVAPNESVLVADNRSGPLFSISQGTLPWQPILWKNDKLPNFVVLAFQNGMGYRYLNVLINSANDACISCANFVKFGSVTPESTELIYERQVRHGKKLAYVVEYLQTYWTDLCNLSTIWKHFTCNYGTVAYLPICQGTLPWQPNNVAVMKANWYYVHSLHVRQMAGRFFRY